MRTLVCSLAAVVFAMPVAAAESSLFRPDPLSVQREGKGYRYPQAGWIVLHVEGEPYERGYQHGRLLAPEIAAFVRCVAAEQGHKDPAGAWRITRTLVNSLFLRKFEAEFLEEMKGIADGASDAGVKYDGRPIDVVDIAALNVWPEIFTLDTANEAWPTGLEGKLFPRNRARAMPPPPGDHCSAFAATGPATADGTIVFGHITMFGLYASDHFNIWLDVKPAKGHRVLMQAFPGGIQSGMDYYMNSAGLLVTETTIRQTRFDINGLALAGRIRKALQYADSIDAAVEILKTANNGLYTNEWLIADTKTNEIAMFELGTHKSKLFRSSRGEWFGGTPGFYWGCNNTKDIDVRLETIASVHDRPANLVWRPSDRDKTWLRLYEKHKGKIGANFGREAFTTAPLAAARSLDAKYTTTAMAKRMETWALFGPPLGITWEPTQDERRRFPEVRPLVSNPWTILHPASPAETDRAVAVADLKSRLDADDKDRDRDEQVHTLAAWRGTLLPKTDADVWLAAAFAEYEKYVALENALVERDQRDRSATTKERAVSIPAANNGSDQSSEPLSPTSRDRLAVTLNTYRSSYLSAARATTDVPLAQTRATPGDEWYRVSVGKGVLLLNELRRTVGPAKFASLMDSFGRAHAGQEVTSAQFRAHCERESSQPLSRFFDEWLNASGIPGGRSVRPFSLMSFDAEREKTLIIFGTRDEEAGNRAAAEEVQRLVRTRWSNQTLAIKADHDVTDADLKSHHLILIGRPDCNALTERFRAAFPVSFGWRSLVARDETLAHMLTAVIAAGENPANPRFAIVVLAGLSAEGTTRTPAALFQRSAAGADVLVLPNEQKAKAFVIDGSSSPHRAAK
jgi:hypothetical protein